VAHLATLRVWDAATGKGDVPMAGGGRAYRTDARGFWEYVSSKLDTIDRVFDTLGELRSVMQRGFFADSLRFRALCWRTCVSRFSNFVIDLPMRF